MLFGSARHTLRTRVRHNYVPPRNALKAQPCHFANVVFVVDDQDFACQFERPSSAIVELDRGHCRWNSTRQVTSSIRGAPAVLLLPSAARNAAWLRPGLQVAAAGRESWPGNTWGRASVAGAEPVSARGRSR